MNDYVRTMQRVSFAIVGIFALVFVAAIVNLPDNPLPPPHAGLSFEIEVDPATGQGRVATINNQTGYAVTNLVLRGTTVRFDLVAPK